MFTLYLFLMLFTIGGVLFITFFVINKKLLKHVKEKDDISKNLQTYRTRLRELKLMPDIQKQESCDIIFDSYEDELEFIKTLDNLEKYDTKEK